MRLPALRDHCAAIIAHLTIEAWVIHTLWYRILLPEDASALPGWAHVDGHQDGSAANRRQDGGAAHSPCPTGLGREVTRTRVRFCHVGQLLTRLVTRLTVSWLCTLFLAAMLSLSRTRPPPDPPPPVLKCPVALFNGLDVILQVVTIGRDDTLLISTADGVYGDKVQLDAAPVDMACSGGTVAVILVSKELILVG